MTGVQTCALPICFPVTIKGSERIMKTSGKGAGAYTGMLAQASFAAEDFIQGIAMGDLRAALLGASNNITMVARGAFEAAEGVTILGMSVKAFAAYALAIPGAIIGAVASFSYLSRAEKDVRDLATALRDAERGFELLGDRMNFRQNAQRESQRINDIEDLTQAQKEYEKVLMQQKDTEEQLTAAQAKQTRAGSETLINILGGQAAYAELQNLINTMRESGHQLSMEMGQALEASVGKAMTAAKAGEVENMINSLRELNKLMNDVSMMNYMAEVKVGSWWEEHNMLLNDLTSQDALESLFNTGFFMLTENSDELRKIREQMLTVTRETLRAISPLTSPAPVCAIVFASASIYFAANCKALKAKRPSRISSTSLAFIPSP